MGALRPLDVETILVGANALVAQGIAAATYDVDVGVRRRDFDIAARRLRELGWRIDVIGNSLSATSPRGEEVELIHPGPFGPRHDPDAFFEYLRDEGSVGTELGRAARPEAVWYMRLGFEPEAGRQKVLRDIRLGLFADPGALLDRVAELGARMGRSEGIEPHLAWLRERLGRA